jgi:hypothetical protein
VIARAGGTISLSDLVRALPGSRTNIVRARNELVAEGWMAMQRSTTRVKGTPRDDRPITYTLTADANPRAKTGSRHANKTTHITITDELGRSASRWILRAVYEREQLKTGAIQIPNSLVGHLAGMTKDAVKTARRRWIKVGEMERVHVRTAANRPGVFTLTTSTYPVDLSRFIPDYRRWYKVEHDDLRILGWGTREEFAYLWMMMHRYGELAHDWIITTAGAPANAALAITRYAEFEFSDLTIPQ